ncbi:Protein SDE2-like protein [Sciurus carolinensis]|uniref:Replication stress response regulator SDE2 n=1 Tax=Sciurus carolinensis TaxID=30640 RepID=A0AA41N9Z2_SCICA|nr:Protein SDE2-like protein [Sciurus carolinensis]
MVVAPSVSGQLEVPGLGKMAGTMSVAWIRGPGFGCKAVWCASDRCSVRDFIHRYCQNQDVPVEYFFVKCNGTLISINDTVQHGAVYSLEPRLRGGKGGFGSMLRALGAQIEKTTNREACRDLSGRRLRDVNHEKAMAEWVKQQAEREAEKEQKRLERLQRKLAEPKHCFASPDYQQQCHEMAERLEDSVLKGMQAASSKMVSAEISENRKRPNKSKTDQGASAKKRKCFWHDVEMAGELPSSSQREEELSTDSGLSEQVQSPVTDSGKSISEDLGAELGETSTKEHEGRKMVREAETKERKKAECQELIEREAAGAGWSKDKEKKEITDGEIVDKVAPGEIRENVSVDKLEEKQSGNTVLGQEAMDLLAFSSAAELESLGLEKLKSELMALGLKCGGTLQERAARLFSVRGLAKEQIDPTLFAKPLKGKKK